MQAHSSAIRAAMGIVVTSFSWLSHADATPVGVFQGYWHNAVRSIPTVSASTRASLPPITIQSIAEETPCSRDNQSSSASKRQIEWDDLDHDLHNLIQGTRPFRWYPGHIAKAEKELKEQLKFMDVVIEVRDARIPLSTSHPMLESWARNKHSIVVLNREDMITKSDRSAWANYFSQIGVRVLFSNSQLGKGTSKIRTSATSIAKNVNAKRRSKGLLPRPIRAGIIGYPNVGKSSLINRLLRRRMCPAAPRPGVTRELRWVHAGKELELLDSPGILPVRVKDKKAALKLAICDDIGEKSYDVVAVAEVLVQLLAKHPDVGSRALHKRYKFDANGHCGPIFVERLSRNLFGGDTHLAACRILNDFRKGKFGFVALERPPNM